ncbi:hypothetical protein Ddc_19553 [Ditylenchus destructor]|nr:hypothetical protein Ddc_19553 [Ditylenchus destructor]
MLTIGSYAYVGMFALGILYWVKDRAIDLNLRSNHLLIHPDSFANKIRRLETDIRIGPGNGVLIEVVNKT